MDTLNSKVPAGPVAEKWTRYKSEQHLVNPANKRKLDVIVVGTGLAGASAAASLGALGFNVKIFCISDSPRRAHSIAAQGGINAAKNYQNDGDSVYRLFYDTVKGGDYRAREANVYRLAEVSNAIIDQCVAQGVPFARDYAGYLCKVSKSFCFLFQKLTKPNKGLLSPSTLVSSNPLGLLAFKNSNSLSNSSSFPIFCLAGDSTNNL